MNDTDANDSVGVASASSAAPSSGALEMQSIASFVARRALGISSSLNGSPASAANVAALCTPGGQQAALLDFLETARPLGVDVDRWLDWYEGGAAPVKAKALIRPLGKNRSPSELLDRRVKQTSKLELTIARAKVAHAKAAEEIEEMEADLMAARSANAAVLQFAFFERMMEIVRSNPAVGPLWAFARAISAVDPDVDPDVSKLSQTDRELHFSIAEKRRKETDLIFETLDFMCGNPRFESQLRGAILRLIEAVEPQIEKRKADGHKPRPLSKVRTTMPPTSRDEIIQIMDGIPQI